MEIDDFFSFSGPAQSNRKPSLLPMWASEDRETGQIGKSVFLDRSKVTFGWAAIPSKAAMPGWACVFQKEMTSSNNVRMIFTFSQNWITFYKNSPILQSKTRVSESDLWTAAHISSELESPLGFWGKIAFRGLTIDLEVLVFCHLSSKKNSDLISKCSFLLYLLWF